MHILLHGEENWCSIEDGLRSMCVTLVCVILRHLIPVRTMEVATESQLFVAFTFSLSTEALIKLVFCSSKILCVILFKCYLSGAIVYQKI